MMWYRVKKTGIAIMLLVFLDMAAGQPLCADEEDHLKIPLISSSSKVLFMEDFRRMTEIIAKSDDTSSHEVIKIATPYNGYDRFSLVLWNLCYGGFYPLNDWLYFSLYGGYTGGGGFWDSSAAFGKTTLLLGSGFVLKFDYLALGLGVDLCYDSDYVNQYYKNSQKIDIFDDFPKYLEPGFVVYPVLNTGKYPFLRYLEKIASEVTAKKTKSPDAIFESIAWASTLVFKYLFNIPVFNLYVKSGKNDFFPEYDLSENYTGIKSLTYGGVIGTETFSVEGSYTMVTENFIERTTTAGSQKKNIPYPFGLNGFPAFTFHWRPDFSELYFYLRLSTAQGMFLLSEDNMKKFPVIPTIGLASEAFNFFSGGRKGIIMGSFSIPFTATIAFDIIN